MPSSSNSRWNGAASRPFGFGMCEFSCYSHRGGTAARGARGVDGGEESNKAECEIFGKLDVATPSSRRLVGKEATQIFINPCI